VSKYDAKVVQHSLTIPTLSCLVPRAQWTKLEYQTKLGKEISVIKCCTSKLQPYEGQEVKNHAKMSKF